MAAKPVQHNERTHHPHWLRGFGAWTLDELHPDDTAWLLAIRRKSPDVYHMMRAKRAFVLADREGNVFELRMSNQSLGDANLAFLADLPHLKLLQLDYCQCVRSGDRLGRGLIAAIGHRSEPMERGRKYVLRTDVMYDLL